MVQKQYRIFPYKMGSKGAGRLAEGLRNEGERCFKVFSDRNYRPRQTHKIINWGNSSTPQWLIEYGNRFPFSQLDVLNWPQYIANASNKLMAFNIMRDAGVSIPEFTTDESIAQRWYLEGIKVVGRSKLKGHSGDGIYITDDLDYPQGEGGMDVIMMREVVGHQLPLYVKYIKKSDEYRVHIVKGTIIDVQQKKKRQEIPNEEVNYQVRNHSNGWVYCRDGVLPPESVSSDALSAMDALGLDFGAVDIIWNNHYKKSYVLEINTAPGLTGTTLNKYIHAFKQVV